MIADLREVYVRLFAELAAGGGGASDAERVTGSKNVKRIPIRADVSDLIADIERAVHEYAMHVCDLSNLPFCIYSRRRVPGEPSPRTLGDMQTIEALLPWVYDDSLERFERRLSRLLSVGRRCIWHEDELPGRVSEPCPVCQHSSIFEVDSERVCCNPKCAVEGNRRRWSEGEWLAATSWP